MPKVKEVDVVDTIDKEQKKRKAKSRTKVKPKAKESEEVPPQKKKIEGLPKKKQIEDTTKNLPDKLAEQRVVCKEVGHTSVSKVALSDIVATSKSIYVDDIHHANPNVLQTVYWALMPNTRHVCARMTEEEYERVYKLTANKINHHVAVVDCAVSPTLSYGSWERKSLKKDFPSPDQIDLYDKKFKENPTMFHNPPVRLDIIDDTNEETDDEFDFDFSDED